MRSEKTSILLLAALMAASCASVLAAEPLGTAFTYQGQLKHDGAPMDGSADLRFTMWDSATGGAQVGDSLLTLNKPIIRGLFTAELDFGPSAFAGDACWLQIEVRVPPGVGTYTVLTPRQSISPTPYARFSQRANLALPFSGSIDDTSTALAVTNMGAGKAAWFETGNAANDNPTLYVEQRGLGRAGHFRITNSANERAAVSASTMGPGVALAGYTTGDGSAIYGRTDGSGYALHLDSTGDVEPAGGGVAMFGQANGYNIAIDNNEVMARNNGQVSTLHLNNDGGAVALGGDLKIGNPASPGINLGIHPATGSFAELYNLDGVRLIDLHVEGGPSYPTMGTLTLRSVDGRTGGELRIANDDGMTRIRARGGGPAGAGSVELFFGGLISFLNESQQETVEIKGEEFAGEGGNIVLRKYDGTATIEIDGEKGTGRGGYVSVQGGDSSPAMFLESSGRYRDDATLRVNSTQPDRGMAAYLTSNSDNYATMHVQNDGAGETLWLVNNGGGNVIVARNSTGSQFWVDGDGVTNTRVIRIHGGADLSEGFDLQARTGDPQVADDSTTPEPRAGMVVSIDPENPGKLTIASEPYDRKVAGIISGAGGVQPGMLMAQAGTDADGHYPVALTGRVYCLCDASSHAIEPGDLLTTSDVPGHAMKVTEPDRAHGAIIGKAMNRLGQGEKGLVLVLVSLQ